MVEAQKCEYGPSLVSASTRGKDLKHESEAIKITFLFSFFHPFTPPRRIPTISRFPRTLQKRIPRHGSIPKSGHQH